jgi:SAM-dependent methyltransferase
VFERPQLLRRRTGPVGAAVTAARQLLRVFVFGWRWKGDTEGAPGAGDVVGDRRPYVPSSWFVLPAALRHRPPRAGDVFLDVGSGKGRVVLQAARYPYRRVIGVELSPELTAVARANVELNRHRLTVEDIELVTADIADYEMPGDVTTVFAFSPLYGDAFQALIEKLADLADRRGSRVTFIYSFPDEHERLMASGRARHVGRVRPGLLTGVSAATSFYEILPTNGAPA